MKQENKKCGSCGSFSAYYTMGYCCLMRENNGYCGKHNKVAQKSDFCDDWRCRHISRKKRTIIAVNSIPVIYKKVAVMEQILQDDNELRKILDEADSASE